MASVDPFAALNAANASGGTATTSNAAGSADRFLRLLVTQMQNQDPLNPLDNAQVTSQMAQISTVSGIDKLNDTMGGLAQAMASSQTMASVSMIGRRIIAPSTTLDLANKSATGAVELAEAADRVSVTITAAAGNIVRRIDLGAMPAGLQQFTWDGKTDAGAAAVDGAYSYKIEAMKNGKPISASTYAVGTVSSVGIAGTDASLILNGGKEVKFADVRRVQ